MVTARPVVTCVICDYGLQEITRRKRPKDRNVRVFTTAKNEQWLMFATEKHKIRSCMQSDKGGKMRNAHNELWFGSKLFNKHKLFMKVAKLT